MVRSFSIATMSSPETLNVAETVESGGGGAGGGGVRLAAPAPRSRKRQAKARRPMSGRTGGSSAPGDRSSLPDAVSNGLEWSHEWPQGEIPVTDILHCRRRRVRAPPRQRRAKISRLTGFSRPVPFRMPLQPEHAALGVRHRHSFDGVVGRHGIGMQRRRQPVDALRVQRVHLEAPLADDAGASRPPRSPEPHAPGRTASSSGASWSSR